MSHRAVVSVLLCGLLAIGSFRDAGAQTCARFVNASDGSDTNPGTISAPWRSLEFAFASADDGARVCVAAGEYFFGDDADGIAFVAEAKSVTFLLTPFAGRTEVRLSEDALTVDVGSGSVRFEPNGMDRLALGSGVTNSPGSYPGNTNFMHSLRLKSGTLDVETVDLVIGAAVGNPEWVPAGSGRSPVASAAIERSDGVLAGDPTFAPAARRFVYAPTSGSLALGSEFPASMPAREIVVVAPDLVTAEAMAVGEQGRVSVTGDGVLRVADGFDVGDGGRIVVDGSARLEIAGRLRLGTPPVGPMLDLIGNGSADIAAIESTGQPELRSAGAGRLGLHDMGDAAGIRMSCTGTGGLDLGDGLAQSVAMQLTVGPECDARLLSPFTIGGAAASIVNEGLLAIGAHSLRLEAPIGTLDSEGTIAADGGGRVVTSGNLALRGSGSLPTVVVEPGTLELESGRIEGDVDLVAAGAILAFRPASRVRIDGSVHVPAGAGLDTPPGTTIALLGDLDAAPGALLRLDGVALALTGDTPQTLSREPLTGLASITFDAVFVDVPARIATDSVVVLGGGVHLSADVLVQTLFRIGDGTSVTSEAVRIDLEGAFLVGSSEVDLHRATLDLGPTAGPFESDVTVTVSAVESTSNELASSGALVVDGPVVHDGGAWHHVGTLTAESSVEIAGGVLRIDGTLEIGGDVTGAGGLELTNADLLSVGPGVRSLSVPGPIDVRSLTLQAGTLNIDHPITIQESLTLAPDTRMDLAADARAAGELSMGARSVLRTNGPSLTLSGRGHLDAGALLDASGSLLRLENAGTAALVVDGRVETTDLAVTSAGPFTIAGGTSTVRRRLSVPAGSELELTGHRVDLTGAVEDAALAIDGRYTTSAGAQVRFVGPELGAITPEIRGTGMLGNVRVAFAEDSRNVRIATGSAPVLSGELYLEVGGLDLNGAILDLSSERAVPRVVRDVSDQVPTAGRPDGGSIVDLVGGGAFNPSDTPYSLRYVGSLAAAVTMGSELAQRGLIDLEILAEDGVNTPSVLAVGLPRSVEISGDLTVAEGTVLDLRGRTVTLLGNGRDHRIDGRALDGVLRVEGSGTLSSDTAPGIAGVVDSLQIASPDSVSVVGLRRIGRLAIASGRIGLAMSPDDVGAPGHVTEGMQLYGGRVTFTTPLYLGMPGTRAALAVNDGHLHLAGTAWIGLAPSSAVAISPSAVVSTDAPPYAPGSPDRGGFLVFEAEASIGAPSGVPRIRIEYDPARATSDNLVLTDDLLVTDALVLVDGDVFADSHALTVRRLFVYDQNGTPGDGTEDGLFGNAGASKVSFEGAGSIRLGSTMVVIGPDFEVQPLAPTDTVRVTTLDPSNPASIRLAGGMLRHGGGTLDLGRSQLRIVGARTTSVALAGGSVTATGSPAFPVVPGKTPLDAGYFPFRAEDFGGLVIDTPGPTQMTVSANTRVTHLAIRAPTTLAPGSGVLRVGDRLALGSGNAGLSTGADGRLEIDAGAWVLRQGVGGLDRAPVFLGSVSVAYDLGDGTISGVDSEFSLGALETGPEIPTAVDRLAILAGSSGGAVNELWLSADLHVRQGIALLSGRFNPGTYRLRASTGAFMAWHGVDPAAPPSVLPGFAGLAADGPIDLFFSLGDENLTLTDAEYPPGLPVRHLRVELGLPGSALVRELVVPPNRTVARFTVANGTTAARVRLSTGTFRVTGGMDVASGTVQSGSGLQLSVGGSLDVGAGGRMVGGYTTIVTGSASIRGELADGGLEIRGDLAIPGRIGPSVDLSFTGTAQRLVLPADGLVVRSLTVAETAGSVPAALTLASGTGHPAELTVSEALRLRGGVVFTGPHDLVLPGSGAGFDRDPVTDLRAHIVGRVTRSLPADATGEWVYPVGSAADYRPLTLAIGGRGLLQSARIEVNHDDRMPQGTNGLPLSLGGRTARSAAPFFWTVRSDADLAATQSVDIAVVGGGLGATVDHRELAILRRSASSVSEPWRIQEGSYASGMEAGQPFVRVADTRELLAAEGTVVTIGLPQDPTIPDAWIGIVHADPNPDRARIDVYANDDRISENMGFRRAAGLFGLVTGSGSAPVRFRITDAFSRDAKDAVLDSTITLVRGDSVLVVFLADGSGAPQLRAVPWSVGASAPGSFDWTFLQALADAGRVRMRERVMDFRPPGTLDVGDTVTGPAVPAGRVIVELLDAETEVQIGAGEIVAPDWTGERLLLVATGYLNPPGEDGSRAFGLIGVTARGDVRLGDVVTGAEGRDGLPGSFSLRGNYPNPFNPATTIVFDLHEQATVRLTVVDMLGRIVAVHDAGAVGPGASRQLRFDASRLASGVYVYRLEAAGPTGRHTAVGRFVLLR